MTAPRHQLMVSGVSGKLLNDLPTPALGCVTPKPRIWVCRNQDHPWNYRYCRISFHFRFPPGEGRQRSLVVRAVLASYPAWAQSGSSRRRSRTDLFPSGRRCGGSGRTVPTRPSRASVRVGDTPGTSWHVSASGVTRRPTRQSTVQKCCRDSERRCRRTTRSSGSDLIVTDLQIMSD